MSKHLPLHAVHQQIGATFAEVDGWLVPARYGDPGAEHETVRERAGRDRSLRAREDRRDGQGPRDLPSRDRLERRQGADSGAGQRIRAPRRAREGHGPPRGPLLDGPPRARDGWSAGGAAPERDRPLPLLRARRAGGRDGRLGDPHRRGPERAQDRGAGARRRRPRSAPPAPCRRALGRGGAPSRPDGGDGGGWLRRLGRAGRPRRTLGPSHGGRRPADRARGVGPAQAGGGRGSGTGSTWTARRFSWRPRSTTPTP